MAIIYKIIQPHSRTIALKKRSKPELEYYRVHLPLSVLIVQYTQGNESCLKNYVSYGFLKNKTIFHPCLPNISCSLRVCYPDTDAFKNPEIMLEACEDYLWQSNFSNSAREDAITKPLRPVELNTWKHNNHDWQPVTHLDAFSLDCHPAFIYKNHCYELEKYFSGYGHIRLPDGETFICYIDYFFPLSIAFVVENPNIKEVAPLRDVIEIPMPFTMEQSWQ